MTYSISPIAVGTVAIIATAGISACATFGTPEEQTMAAVSCVEGNQQALRGPGRRGPGQRGPRRGRGSFNSPGCEEFVRPWFAGAGRGSTPIGGSRGFAGLGPLFNDQSCIGCHTAGGASDLIIVQVSVPGQNADGSPKAHPAYGGQIQDLAVRGVRPEARVRVSWRQRKGTYGDGTSYTLEEPTVELTRLGYGPLGEDALLSPRRIPTVFNTGAFDRVHLSALEALADPDDQNGDGISGRLNRVWDIDTKTHKVGRYGWKAAQPTLETQIATAFVMDMGIVSDFQPNETCTPSQTACRQAPGLHREISMDRVQVTADFSRRLNTQPSLSPNRRGAEMFNKMQCAACHTPSLPTATGPVHVYTDLLLHDMGPDLADGRPQFQATGSEWRTAPLAGLSRTLHRDQAGLLHDGRARTVAEAILWHGGEGEGAREAFRAAPAADRKALVEFVEGL